LNFTLCTFSHAALRLRFGAKNPGDRVNPVKMFIRSDSGQERIGFLLDKIKHTRFRASGFPFIIFFWKMLKRKESSKSCLPREMHHPISLGLILSNLKEPSY